MVYAAALALLYLSRLPAALAHARVTTQPPIRSPGPAFEQACGQTSFNSVSQDPTGHIEEQEPVNAGCELTLCRGMLFADQPASNVMQVQPSQNLAMNVDCTVPHGGPANVSLVDTTVGGSGAIVGSFLKTFDDFCPTSGPAPADQTDLQYTLPDAQTVGSRCQSPGDCVVQLFWATPDFSQNYYYCVDVVMAAAQPPASTTPAVITTATSAAVAPPVTTPAVAPAPTPPVSQVNVPAASPPSLSRMVTSIVSAPAGNAAAATGVAAAQNGNATTTGTPNTSAGRRRARILWF